MVSAVLIAIFMIALTACESSTPSLGFAPSQPLVQKAITLQVSQIQQQLAQQLQSSPPHIEIARVVFKQLKPLFIDNLPTYRVLGTYSLKIQLQQQQVIQQENSFDVYLQRQKEGKTWRLLLPDHTNSSAQPNWHSYLIR